ncbi:MAG TPA: FemAB family XrtA/PEP-CTERM system-associated protein [Gemmatimonadaceae bacterium]|nr:FemAB family XrtA/PEP-CTERM system-associated protein [Gemmatimonadaceae bacterium]
MISVDRFDGTEAEWNRFAAEQRGYTHYHRLEWRSLIGDVFGHECLYLSAREGRGRGAELTGVLPLVRVRSMVFGHYLVSMPFLNYGGPLGNDAAIRALVAEASELARRDKVKLLELRSKVPLDVSLPASHRKITVVLDLPADEDVLFHGFDAKLRSQIRRPQKEGVTVEFGSEQVVPFFTVFARHMHDLGTPALPLRFFRELADRFSEDCWFACAYLSGRPVAASCGFQFGGEFEMTWASSLRSHNREAPNMLLYWACMQRAISRGLERFNFGRCTPGAGTHRFKMQWGGREEPLWWYGLASSKGAATPSPHDSAFRFGPRLWRRLPESIATAVGPSIVRYIP